MTSLAFEHLPPPPAPAPGRDRGRQVGQSALILVGAGTALIALRTVSIHLPACPFRAATGVPCPGCGMTRLADSVAHGRIAQAVTADAAGVAILGVLAVLAVTYLVQVTIRKDEPPAWMRSPLLLVGIGVLVAAHWITTIVTGGLPSS